LFASQNYDAAIEDLRNSIENKPFPTYESDLYYHIGISYSRKEEYELSIEPLTICINMCPNEAVYYHERAKSYQLIEEHNLALEDFNVVIRM